MIFYLIEAFFYGNVNNVYVNLISVTVVKLKLVRSIVVMIWQCVVENVAQCNGHNLCCVAKD